MSDSGHNFRYINSQGVIAEAGFIVQRTGRFTLEYRLDNFRMECECDAFIVGNSIGLGVGVPPLPFGNLTPAGHLRIIAEIRAALDFMGIENTVS